MAPVRTLITGCTGFIGKRLVRKLAGIGDVHPILFARNESNYASLILTGFEVRKGDFFEPDTLAAALDGVDCVVHLASHMDFYPGSDPSMVFKVNVDGTRALLQAAHAAKVRRFVFVSSTEAIGPTDISGAPSDETTPERPVYAYGRSKVEAESVVRQFHKEHSSMDYIILRPTLVVGPGDEFAFDELMGMVHLGILCFIPGSGSALAMATHVDDVVQSVLLSVSPSLPAEALNQTYIICADEALPYKEALRLLLIYLNRLPPFFHLPLPMAKVAVSVIAPIMNIGRKRVFMYHPDTVAAMGEFRNYSNAKAKRLLGFRPKFTMEHSISDTVKWCRSRNKYRTSSFDPISPLMLRLAVIIMCIIVIWLLSRTIAQYT